MPNTDIVILGGGVGGVVALNVLRDRLGDTAEITLVDKSPYHTFKPTFLRVLTGEENRTDALEPLTQFEDRVVSFEQAEVTEIDSEGHQVETTTDSIDYDYLIVALGAQYDEQAIPGFETANHVYTGDAAETYREALEAFQGGDLVIGVSRTPYLCPAAPVESALLTDYFLQKRGLREDTRMQFFFPKPAPMKKAGENVGKTAVRALENRNIEYAGNMVLSSIDDEAGEVRFEDGSRWAYDLLFATPPHKAPDVVTSSPLADESGWIPVDRHTMQTDADDVYAVGDNAKVMIPSIGKPVPKAGVFARKQAEVAAQNIASRIHGRDSRHHFDGVGQCFLASKYGLNGEAGMIEADFFANGAPESDIKQPRASKTWHWAKLLNERSWHRQWFPAEEGGGAV